ncbi:MAG: tyrosine-type recombinase/integrase [Methylococcaceae bacterium]|nr:tyrosine-type recombinase/integrase [Methylococcaceae bacterium]
MQGKQASGLILRRGVWYIQKAVKGYGLLRESTGESEIEKAESYLYRRIAEIERQSVHGVRPDRSFVEAATKYLTEAEKKSLDRDGASIKLLIPYIGKLPLRQIHQGTLDLFIRERKAAGISAGTINRDLAVVKNILTLAARLWRDKAGMTWLETVPMIEPVKGQKRKPYPISWDEQKQLFQLLPDHLANMALFAVNTGCRDQEICQLQWKWEEKLPGLNTTGFVIPAEVVKGELGETEEKLVVLNRIARSVIDSQRGLHPEFVFTYVKGKGVRHPIDRMNNNGWRTARKQAGLEQVRVHDLRHTFGRRLRAAGVSMEDRQDLLGHKSGRITTHYSAAEISSLINAVELLCEAGTSPELLVVNLARK